MSIPTNSNQPPPGSKPVAAKGPPGITSARTEREGAEPKASMGQAPMWFLIICALLFMMGQVYLDIYAGGFDPKVYGPFASAHELADAVPKSDDAALISRGEVLYAGKACSACHQATGLGAAGQFPPLAGSEWVNSKDPSRLIRIPLLGLNGPLKVKDQDWNNSMVALGDSLKDDELAAILSYIRQAWGNSAPVVKTEQVKAVRDAIAGRTQSWTSAELLAVPLSP